VAASLYAASLVLGAPPRGEPNLRNAAPRFWETIEGLDTSRRGATSGWKIQHTIPHFDNDPAWAQRWLDKGINIHHHDNLRGMIDPWHETYDAAFRQWVEAKMKAEGLSFTNKGDLQKFLKNVDLDEVLKARNTLLEMEEFKKVMLTAGSKKADMTKVLQNSLGKVNTQVARERAAARSVEALKKSNEKLQEAFPKLKKFLTGLAVFTVIFQGIALANNIANEPPHVRAAWNDFETIYRNILRQRSQGRQISNRMWWDLADKLDAYLEAIGVDSTAHKFITRWFRENVGAPQDDLYWP
jgi:hypothetical protein